MAPFKAGIISSITIALFFVGVGARAANVCSDRLKNEKTNELEKPKIHIDVKRPKEGKVGEEAIYDASASRTPSGNIQYKWEPALGGIEFIGPTDQATLRVKAVPSTPGRSANTYTRITIIDPVCNLQDSARIDVNYWP